MIVKLGKYLFIGGLLFLTEWPKVVEIHNSGKSLLFGKWKNINQSYTNSFTLTKHFCYLWSIRSATYLMIRKVGCCTVSFKIVHTCTTKSVDKSHKNCMEIIVNGCKYYHALSCKDNTAMKHGFDWFNESQQQFSAAKCHIQGSTQTGHKIWI